MALTPARRRRIAEQARYRCGYCLTQEIVSGVALTVEHIIPTARDGQTVEENLWLSCRLCNEAKGMLTEAIDPESGATVPLFNPRLQIWADHFAWSEDSTHVIGQTPTGRSTVKALSLNDELRVRARAIWVEAGWHPPE
ncbi:HNH endonuclease [bacterium]|nr:HNH endonuclease [bacterium]OIO87295.1 MAG: HNH endonuclease [Anaerolineae bacterium CG2_30_58_95]PIW20966.1 MAG: HNH endonuclease [Anaerolineae bacterium CG17_big_fil_post_rev_8_21_14_2_50_57_27]PJH75838.1 MAG: HNH endonuclease [Anaerolineae bacterium CG_4_9_14_0_8_um_filter_58_9]